MNLPNKLTIFRIILVPIMVMIPFLGIEKTCFGIPIEYWLIELVFIIASLTDKLDGYLARKNNQITTFGEITCMDTYYCISKRIYSIWLSINSCGKRWKSHCSFSMGQIKNSNTNDGYHFSFC